MSPALIEILRTSRSWIMAFFAGFELLVVAARSDTVIVLRWGWAARALRTAVPSLPAPRTRVGMWEEARLYGEGTLELRWGYFEMYP